MASMSRNCRRIVWIDNMEFIAYNIAIQSELSFEKGDTMGNKLKVTVTIEEAIVREIDRASKEPGESRSRVIETAIQQWRERELEKQLIDGYRRNGERRCGNG